MGNSLVKKQTIYSFFEGFPKVNFKEMESLKGKGVLGNWAIGGSGDQGIGGSGDRGIGDSIYFLYADFLHGIFF